MLHLAAKKILQGDLTYTEIPNDAISPAFDELSPDLRYKLLRRRAARAWLLNGAVYLAAAGLLTPVAIPQLNAVADEALSQIFNFKQRADTAAAFISPDFAAPVQKGENIAGHTVTSGYGLRDIANLPAGASADHKGVDLATPEGIPLKAIGALGTKVKVQCWQDSDGGGWVAEIEPDSFPDLRFQALHLSPGSCRTGVHDAGSVIAKTGASGIGAPHLDWRQRDRATGKHQHPQKAYLLWALTGRAPNANFTRIDRLRNAIISQESAGDAGVVNKDSSALGLAQIMPDNLAPKDTDGNEIKNSGWDFEALGRDLTPEQFLADPDAQIQIINHQLSKIFDAQITAGKSEDDAIRRTAAAWYSGDPNKASDDTPQNWEGDPSKAYPSIQDYSDDVLERMAQMNDANGDSSSSLAEKIEEKKRQKAAFDLQQERLKQLDK